MALKDDPEFVALKSDLLKEVSSAQIAYEKSQTEAATAKANYENSRTEAGVAKQSYETVRSILDTKWDNIRSTVAMLLSVGTVIFAGTFAYQIFKVEEVQKAITLSEQATSNAATALENISQMYEGTTLIIQAKEFMTEDRFIQAREMTGKAIDLLNKVLRRTEDSMRRNIKADLNHTREIINFERSIRRTLINAYETRLLTFIFLQEDVNKTLDVVKDMKSVDINSWKSDYYLAHIEEDEKEKIRLFIKSGDKIGGYNKSRFNLTELYFSTGKFNKSIDTGTGSLKKYNKYLKNKSLNKVELVMTKLYIDFSTYFNSLQNDDISQLDKSFGNLENSYSNMKEEIKKLVSDKRYDETPIKRLFDRGIEKYFNNALKRFSLISSLDEREKIKSRLLSHKETIKGRLSCMLKDLPSVTNVKLSYHGKNRESFCYGDATRT